MLTIAFVFLTMQLAVTASPSPVDRRSSEEGIRIGLTKRQDLVNHGLADIQALVQSLLNTRSKYENTIEAYRRNTGKEPPISLGGLPMIDNVHPKRATGADPLINDGDVLWHGTISVGTPPVDYTVDFDTGSSDLFLPGPDCTDNCQGHKVYKPASSSTSTNRKKTFKLSYGDGSTVSGQQYLDTVTVGNLTATSQAVGAASTYSDGLNSADYPPDGLLGMGYQSISQYNSPPFIQTLIGQKKLTQPVFGFKLADSGSELFMGGVNTKLYTGNFTYAPVTTQAYWQVNMDSVMVNNASMIKTLSTIIDTGTTLIVGDADNVKTLFSKIPGSKDASTTVGPGFYTVPCKSVPTVKFSFGGKAYAISPDVLNLGRVKAKSPDCVAGIVSGGSDQSFWIIGDVFLRNVYTSFDLGKNRVGFATLK